VPTAKENIYQEIAMSVSFPQVDQDEKQPTTLAATAPQGVQETNVGEDERVMSVAAGAFVTLLGVTRGGLAGLVLTGIGGTIAYRGLTGHCGLYAKLGVNTAKPV
jgi:uncharacterized membrane protein